jgi:hypothetical protein
MGVRPPVVQISGNGSTERDDDKMIRLLLPHLRSEMNGIHFGLHAGIGEIGP